MFFFRKLKNARRYLYQVAWCVPPWGWREFRLTVSCALTFSVRKGSSPRLCGEEIRNALGRRFAIPLRRGSDAILIALRALHLAPTDEVIIPSYVCASVLDAVNRSGARPVFGDIDGSLHMSVRTVEEALTPHTRCVIVPHLFGNIAPIDEIEHLLQCRGIVLIDDAAQGFGARRTGKPVGSFGEFGVVCAGPGKPLAAAAGGLLLVDDEHLFTEAMRQIRPLERSAVILSRLLSFWIWRRLRRYTILLEVALGRNTAAAASLGPSAYALSNIDGAILHEEFRALSFNSERRKQNSLILLRILQPLPWKVITQFGEGTVPLKLVVLLPESGPTIETAIGLMGEAGIECQCGYRPCHYLTDRKTTSNRLLATESTWRRVLCIPIDQPLRNTRGLERLVASQLLELDAFAATLP